MTDPQGVLPDKRQVAASFSRAAASYDSVAELQRAVGAELLARLPGDLVPDRWVDLGSGTGHFSRALAARLPQASGTAVDIAEGMLRHARPLGGASRFVCGDAERLPLATASHDLIFSSLALQWCERPAQAFAELNRVLKPGGQVFFSTLLSGSLWQLREAWRAVDGRDHVNRFLTLPQLQQAARDGGFEAPVLCPLTWSLAYPALSGLLRDLKGIGASQVNDERSAGLGHRQRLVRLGEAYERHRQPDGLLAASYEVCLGRLVRR